MYRKGFILVMVSILVLSGCGRNDDISMDNADYSENSAIQEDLSETEEHTAEGDTSEAEDQADDLQNEPSVELPAALEIPVNIQAADVAYEISDGIDVFNATQRCGSDGENIYLAYGQTDLYVMPLGADYHSPAQLDNPEGLYVCNIAMDTSGGIHLLLTNFDYDKWVIWRLDGDCQTEQVIDISTYFETKRQPVVFQLDQDGNYYLMWPINRDGIVVDSEGALRHRVTPKTLGIGWIYQAAVGKDGQIYLVYSDGDEKLKIGALDVESGSLTEGSAELCFPDSENFTAMSRGTDTNLLLYSPYSGVWAYDQEQGIMENRVPLSDMGFDKGMTVYPLAFLADGRLLIGGFKEGADTGEDGTKQRLLKYIPAGR